MDYQLIAALAAIVTTIGGIFAFFKWGKGLWINLWHRVSRYKPKVPRETVRIVPHSQGFRWSNGTVAGQPSMHLIGRWHVTNITGDPVRLLTARITKPKTEGRIVTNHPIRPGETIDVSANFWITPPVRTVGKDFKATVILSDQYGNGHKIKNVLFRGPQPKPPDKNEPPIEPIYSISDPIEKDVVAVLKAEVNRYKECGRRVGGLGSIQTTIKGKIYKGIGTEWREANSPKNQTIIEDENAVEISSDNAQALINLHAKLISSAEQDRFFDALIERLNKDTEYAPVGYLILYVLFRLDRLSQVLDKAKNDLQGDSAYGFSDMLRLLDGLLRFRHSEFSPEMLDHIEKTIEGLEEHPFRIPERLSAIRAFRLAQKNKTDASRVDEAI
jgi:hypothetical protein